MTRPTIVGTPSLTRREAEVLAGVADGLMNEQIGARLHLSVDTVKTHLRKLSSKLGAANRAHVVAIGYQSGLLGTGAEEFRAAVDAAVRRGLEQLHPVQFRRAAVRLAKEHQRVHWRGQVGCEACAAVGVVRRHVAATEPPPAGVNGTSVTGPGDARSSATTSQRTLAGGYA